MYLDPIPENVKTTTEVRIRYDCNGGFEWCGKERPLLYKYAKKNFEDNKGKHVCRQCQLKTKNPMKRKDVQDKIKQTCLEKYGTVCPLNTKENIENRVEKMFGTQEAIDARIEKTKQTNLEKYGVEHAAQADVCKEKYKETCREKYGSDYPLQNSEVLAKQQATNLEKYGDVCSLNHPDVKAKALKSLFEHYGVEYYNQLPEMKDYLRENCREWLKESWENPWAKGIKRPEEWNQKQRDTVKKLIQEGNWMGGFVSNFKGWFPAWKCKKPTPRFLSILEAKFHLYLNACPQVDYYDYEGLVIEYLKADSTKHDYYVDFQVWYKDDLIQHNFELKAWKNKDRFDTQAKYDAAFEYCNKNSMTYMLLFEADIDKLGISDDIIKNFPGIKQFEKTV